LTTGGAELLAVADVDLTAALAGKTFYKFVVDKTPGADQVVLTDSGLVYNIPTDKLVLLTRIYVGVETISDDCRFELGSCSLADGAGTFSRVMVPITCATGANKTTRDIEVIDLHPPVVVRYVDAKSITFRVDANDASCDITCGFAGWWCNLCTI